MGVDDYLGVSYRLSHSKNFESLMKELRIGVVMRKVGLSMHPTVTLNKNGNVYTLITSTNFKNSSITFQPNVEFNDETIDGRRVISVITFDGNKMIHNQKAAINTEIVREFSDDNLVATIKVNDVVAVRTYTKV